MLSYDVRLAKPDPRIYEMAVEGLGVAAEECLYVGDGTSNELTGASRVGMTAVLMRAPHDQGGRRAGELDGREDLGRARGARHVGVGRPHPNLPPSRAKG